MNTKRKTTLIYKLGGAIALLTVIMTVLSVAAYSQWPYAAGITPTEEIYKLTQENLLAAFTALDWISVAGLVFLFASMVFSTIWLYMLGRSMLTMK